MVKYTNHHPKEDLFICFEKEGFLSSERTKIFVPPGGTFEIH